MDDNRLIADKAIELLEIVPEKFEKVPDYDDIIQKAMLTLRQFYENKKYNL